MSAKFQDAQMDSPLFAHHSSDDEGDHAVFCFCGNEVMTDEDGDVGIYCSTVCARQDALEALESSHSRSSSTSSIPLGPSSYFNLARPPVPSISCPSSLSKPTTVSPFVCSFSETNFSSISPALSTSSSISSLASDGTSSHYRRMEKERIQMQRQRKKEREAAKEAAAQAAAFESFQRQQRIQQQRVEYHQRNPSFDHAYTLSSSQPPPAVNPLSRNNTASSTSSSHSRFISTHPSRSRTPDLIHGSLHGRNESLTSNTSSISSAASAAWGWGSRSGWGSQLREAGEEEMEDPDLIVEEDEEEEVLPEDKERGSSGAGGLKRSKGTMSIVEASMGDMVPDPALKGGLKMGALLDDILDMERGFTVQSPQQRLSSIRGSVSSPSFLGTPPRLRKEREHNLSATPTRSFGLPTSESSQTLRTPLRNPGGNLKRPFASTPPSSPHLGLSTKDPALPAPTPPAQSVLKPRRSTVSSGQHPGWNHRRAVSSPSRQPPPAPSSTTTTTTTTKNNKKPKHRRSFSAQQAGVGRVHQAPSSPVPPLPTMPSRPRTLVYSQTESSLSKSRQQDAGWLGLGKPALLAGGEDDENLAPPLFLEGLGGGRAMELGIGTFGGGGAGNSGDRLRAVLGWDP